METGTRATILPPQPAATARLPARREVSGALARPPAGPEPVQVAPPSGGEPLNAGTRAELESRFGHDFSRVRVHADSAAAESAHRLGAAAYTTGSHVVFGGGQSPHGNPAPRLLVHELTHVVQQQRASSRDGFGLPDDPRERQAERVAGAFAAGGDVSGLVAGIDQSPCPAVQRQPAPAPAGTTTAAPSANRPLDYDENAVRLAVLQSGQTAANLRTVLQANIKAGKITRFATTGVAAGSNAEIFLLGVIAVLGERNRWGTEADLITAIDWPAKAGGVAPQGQVTLRIDAAGAATAELVGTGAVTTGTQTTVAAGSATLRTDFGFASVQGWTGRNAAAEISDVVAAMQLLKARAPQDVGAVKGVDLIRVASLGGDTAGDFSIGEAAAPGKPAPAKPALRLADRAFAANDRQFSGGGPSSPVVPASYATILHEVGHAVEKEALRQSQEVVSSAAGDVDAARRRIQDASLTYDADLAKAKAKGRLNDFYRERAKAYKKDEAEEARAQAKYVAARTKFNDAFVTAADIQSYVDAAAQSQREATAALADARTAIQALGWAETQRAAGVLQAFAVAATAITAFATDAKAGTAPVDDLEVIVYGATTDRDRVRMQSFRLQAGERTTPRSVFLLDPPLQRQDAWLEAERRLARARLRTRRLQKFVDLVTANNIRRFTEYSVRNWEMKPGEFFAEAYSLWLTDPHFLKTNYRVVFDFFENGDHRR